MSKYRVICSPLTIRRYQHVFLCAGLLGSIACLPASIHGEYTHLLQCSIAMIVVIILLPVSRKKLICQDFSYNHLAEASFENSYSNQPHSFLIGSNSLTFPFGLFITGTDINTNQPVSFWLLKGELPESHFRRLSRLVIAKQQCE